MTNKNTNGKKFKGLYLVFTTDTNEEILIDAHCWTLAQATVWATRENASAKYSGTRLFF